MIDSTNEIDRFARLIAAETDRISRLRHEELSTGQVLASLYSISTTLSLLNEIKMTDFPQASAYRDCGKFAEFLTHSLELLDIYRHREERIIERQASDKRILISLVALSLFINIVFAALILRG